MAEKKKIDEPTQLDFNTLKKDLHDVDRLLLQVISTLIRYTHRQDYDFDAWQDAENTFLYPEGDSEPGEGLLSKVLSPIITRLEQLQQQ